MCVESITGVIALCFAAHRLLHGMDCTFHVLRVPRMTVIILLRLILKNAHAALVTNMSVVVAARCACRAE